MAGKKAATYSIDELAAAAEPLFHTRGYVVKAALKATQKSEYTEKEAVQIVSGFITKEVQ